MYTLYQSFRYLLLTALVTMLAGAGLWASSHREAPLIANDPLADNTDVYAFRSPDDPNTVTLIANYVPLQLPHGGPNYYQFGENIRYEIHVDNDVSTPGDDIIYRFTFEKTNNDPTTFFNIRLGAENLQTTYTLERSVDGGQSFTEIVTAGTVPPYNIGPRSIQSLVGLGATDYETLFTDAITMATTGEKIFCGPTDDPFFVDLGGIFDLGDAPRQNGTPRDAVACKNVSTIAIQVPISTLQKDGMDVSQAANILDGDFVIGVWASASRQSMRTLNGDGTESVSGNWVQVSRLGMPLTNEAVIPIGDKDEWNSRTPYNENPAHFEYFYNPELALYMDDAQFGGAVPAFSPLRIQRNSLGAFDFGNGQDGLFGLKGTPAVAGTALDDAVFGTLLLPGPGQPRSVDLWPAFHTGVPNVPPYQLATGKGGNPLAAGKPFVNNFLPNGGDMLRLNMATPVTDRNDPAFSTTGLVAAAVAGLTDPTYTSSANLEFIPNMDGFPNGRRLEDDVTRIELQAVSGVVLAAIGLWYDDYDPNDPNASPVSQDLLDVLTYSTEVEENDTTFRDQFPYVQTPWAGTGKCGGKAIPYDQPDILAPTQSINGFTLVNGQTDQDIGPLADGDTINLADFNTNRLNVRAGVNSDDIESVIFDLGDGTNMVTGFRTENNPPFALAGSSKSGQINYYYIEVEPGTYTITATPFSSSAGAGMEGTSQTITVTVIETDPALRITDFSLVNAFTDQVVGPLTDGMVVDLDMLGTNKLNVIAGTTMAGIGSVGFDLNGQAPFNFDNRAPYALGGDNNMGTFYQVIFSPGTYTLTARAYRSFGGNGMAGPDTSITFTVVENGSNSSRLAQTGQASLEVGELSLYPNPSAGRLTVALPQAEIGGATLRVLSAMGTEVRRERLMTTGGNFRYKYDLGDLPAGMYFIQLQQGEQVFSKPFMKQ